MSPASANANAITPLTPSAFTTGRWSGGRGTIVDAYFITRKVQPKGGGNAFTIIEGHAVIEDEMGEKHDVPYQVNFKDPLVIRETADADADEAERGYAISGGGPRADQDFAALVQALLVNGFLESKLADGDVRAIIGVDAEWVEKPHKGVKEDKYPMLLPTEIYGGAKGGASAKTGSKRKAADDDDEGSSKKSKGAKDEKVASGASAAIEKRTRKYVLTAAKENDGTTTDGDVVRFASKDLKNDDDREAILDLLGSDKWLAAQDELWSYNRKTGVITLE